MQHDKKFTWFGHKELHLQHNVRKTKPLKNFSYLIFYTINSSITYTDKKYFWINKVANFFLTKIIFIFSKINFILWNRSETISQKTCLKSYLLINEYPHIFSIISMWFNDHIPPHIEIFHTKCILAIIVWIRLNCCHLIYIIAWRNLNNELLLHFIYLFFNVLHATSFKVFLKWKKKRYLFLESTILIK